MTEEEKTATVLAEEDEFDETQVAEGEQQAESKAEDAQEKPKPQSRERNHEEAEKRRERQAKAKAEKEARDAAIRKARTEGQLELVKENPFTNEPIQDEDDLEVYKLQLEIDKDGGDPINDLPKYIAKKSREQKAKQAEEEANTQKWKEQADREVEELRKAYPSLDLGQLSKDPDFQKFQENKLGRWTLLEMYEGYQRNLADSKAAKETKSEQSEVDKAAETIVTPPNPESSGVKNKAGFMEMSDEAFEAYNDKMLGRV